MRRPFRRWCFDLAQRLGMGVEELQARLSSAEIYEWMAYTLTHDPDWLKRHETDKQREMTADEHAKFVLSQLGL